MRLHRILNLTVVTSGLVLGGSAFAADSHDHGKEHAHGKEENHFKVAAPETVRDAWTLMTAKVAAADTALTAKDVSAVHEASEHMEAAVHTLQEKSDMVAADARAKVASALKQLDKAVDEIHHSTEDKNADAAAAALTKIKGLLPLVEGLYPAGTLK